MVSVENCDQSQIVAVKPFSSSRVPVGLALPASLSCHAWKEVELRSSGLKVAGRWWHACASGVALPGSLQDGGATLFYACYKRAVVL